LSSDPVIVTTDAERCSCKPCFVGTRVPVDIFFDNLAAGCTIDEISEAYPSITKALAIETLRQACAALGRAAVVIPQIATIECFAGRSWDTRTNERESLFGCQRRHLVRGFTIELRAEASDYVTNDAQKLGTTRAEAVRKALNLFAYLNDNDFEVILLNRATRDRTRLLIGAQRK
jgi:uncharacterized protein (DUF433 family)